MTDHGPDDFLLWARGGNSAVRARLRRIGRSIEAGDPLDAGDAEWLGKALRAADEQWPDTPDRPTEEIGRVLAGTFGVQGHTGRKSLAERSYADELPRIELARAVVKLIEQDEPPASAVLSVAVDSGKSESTVRRAYNAHRERVEMLRRAIRELVARFGPRES